MLEADVEQLKARLRPTRTDHSAWWDRIVGTFADDPAFEEAARLGREHRQAQRQTAMYRIAAAGSRAYTHGGGQIGISSVSDGALTFHSALTVTYIVDDMAA